MNMENFDGMEDRRSHSYEPFTSVGAATEVFYIVLVTFTDVARVAPSTVGPQSHQQSGMFRLV